MAHYLIKAKIVESRMAELKTMLDKGDIRVMKPFGTALHYSMRNARIAADGLVTWEEEDYCSPPLAMERKAVLDTYFQDLQIERVNESEGWASIESLPFLWELEKLD